MHDDSPRTVRLPPSPFLTVARAIEAWLSGGPWVALEHQPLSPAAAALLARRATGGAGGSTGGA